MNPIQAISTFFTVIAILLSSADTTRAQSSEQKGVPEIEKPKLAGRFYQHSTPHVGEVTRGILTAATNQFSFVVPEGFRRRIDIKDKSICLTSASLTASLTAKICETVVDGQVDLKPESVRQLVLGRYQNSRIVEEFNASIESMTGPAFESSGRARPAKCPAALPSFRIRVVISRSRSNRPPPNFVRTMPPCFGFSSRFGPAPSAPSFR
jgi:hypothetical protein